MKLLAAVASLLLLLLTAGCFDESGGGKGGGTGPLFRWQFVGREALARATNGTRFKEIYALPATEELRGQLSTNLARAALKVWQKDLPPGASDPTAYLHPLFRDFLTAEGYVEVTGSAGSTETVLALNLNDERARLWSTNLWQLAGAWKLGQPQAATVEGFKGWELKKTSAPNLMQFLRAGQWVIVGLGQDKLTLAPALLQQVKQSQRPVAALQNAFLDVRANLPGLREWFPLFAQYPLPPAHLTLMGRGDNVRTELRLSYPVPVPWKFEPWTIPTNLVSEPLTSFTVARGVAPFFAKTKGLAGLGLQPVPNQFCAWGISNNYCRLYYAFPMASAAAATNAMNRLSLTLPPYVQSVFGETHGDFFYRSNKAHLAWGGLPFVSPFLGTARSGDHDFVFGGIFPLDPRRYPAPPDLYAQFEGRNNVLYYDWEETSQRLDHGKQLYELANIAAKRLGVPKSGSRRWLAAIAPRLGNTVTEITLASPQELLLVRKSQMGLTGFELATFSAWLDSASFPYAIDLMPRIGASARPGAAHTNAPNARSRPPATPKR